MQYFASLVSEHTFHYHPQLLLLEFLLDTCWYSAIIFFLEEYQLHIEQTMQYLIFREALR